jgi:hypothetical protein
MCTQNKGHCFGRKRIIALRAYPYDLHQTSLKSVSRTKRYPNVKSLIADRILRRLLSEAKEASPEYAAICGVTTHGFSTRA